MSCGDMTGSYNRILRNAGRQSMWLFPVSGRYVVNPEFLRFFPAFKLYGAVRKSSNIGDIGGSSRVGCVEMLRNTGQFRDFICERYNGAACLVVAAMKWVGDCT